ncbi:hypothetical protein A2Y83_01150 [Candidatus Falkowbacteria bacterium RBG_13_39_14]|uniref:Uncharacterized protein n=1 Tax=Candidatus Falkowbacteria bacterium RBG_13_39_14 TaxID=1797985 RepID=A0A1F5S164_9BACT|nr:MAG: hypothetical protein A2Y83_01150 [Candidatus Falkowbacteria bacterium RBG_13_39_14]
MFLKFFEKGKVKVREMRKLVRVIFLALIMLSSFSPVLAKDLDLSMVIPGDIILGRAPTADHAKDTYYTHAALVVDKNTTIEILGKGYYVDIYPISNWKTLFQRSYYQKVVVLRVKDISDYHRTAAINKAKEQWGKPYSWKYPYVKFPNPGYHYCSSTSLI